MQRLRWRFSFYRAEDQEYEAKELAFWEVQHVEPSAFALTLGRNGEVGDHRAFVAGGQTAVEFLLMDGLNQQSFTVRFLYHSYALQ